jgi:hypothetical protein
MLYSNTEQPCTIDISKPVVLVKYQVMKQGKQEFLWQLQPNATDAGCVMQFASFRTTDEKEGHSE